MTGSAILDMNEAMPSACLKCGARNGITPRVERMSAWSPRARVTAALLGVALALVLVVAVYEPIVGVALLAGLAVAKRLVRLGVDAPGFAAREVTLPLCVPCDARWSRAIAWRWAFIGGALVGAVLLAWGLIMARTLHGAAPGALVVILVGGAAALRRLLRSSGPAFVVATRFDGDRVTLLHVHPQAAAVLDAGPPPPPPKRKAKRSGRAKTE